VVSADAHIYIYTNRCGNCKVILGPAGHALRSWPAGKKNPRSYYYVLVLFQVGTTLTRANSLFRMMSHSPVHSHLVDTWVDFDCPSVHTNGLLSHLCDFLYHIQWWGHFLEQAVLEHSCAQTLQPRRVTEQLLYNQGSKNWPWYMSDPSHAFLSTVRILQPSPYQKRDQVGTCSMVIAATQSGEIW